MDDSHGDLAVERRGNRPQPGLAPAECCLHRGAGLTPLQAIAQYRIDEEV